MPILPDEIIFDILSRLPVVSLCRFRCVSQPWRSLISHPHFIRTHLNRNSDYKHERLILCSDWDLFSADLESAQFGDESVAVPLIFPTKRNPIYCHDICGSCDGLLLVGCLDYYFVNPSTREMRKLPDSPFTVGSEKYVYGYGFGYDSSNDDYKVALVAMGEVTKEIYKENPHFHLMEPLNYDRFLVISLGTGTPKIEHLYTAKMAAKWGIYGWLFNNGHAPLASAFNQASSHMVDYHLSVVFEVQSCKENYLRIQAGSRPK